MPERCRTCHHPRRAEIDAELGRHRRRSLRVLSLQFNVSPHSLWRHEINGHVLNAGGGEARQTTQKLPAEVGQARTKKEPEARQLAENCREKEPEVGEGGTKKERPLPWGDAFALDFAALAEQIQQGGKR